MNNDQENKTEKRFDSIYKMALDMNAELPTDVMLKGDGSIWATVHGNDGTRPRKLTQQEVLVLLYKAIRFGDRMISV